MSAPMPEAVAEDFFAALLGGKHHIPRSGLHRHGFGWLINFGEDLATFDSDLLTRLVFLAHDRCVRVEICGASSRYVRICIHERKREGVLYERHPTLQQAVAGWRATHAERKEPGR